MKYLLIAMLFMIGCKHTKNEVKTYIMCEGDEAPREVKEAYANSGGAYSEELDGVTLQTTPSVKCLVIRKKVEQ